MLRDTVDFDVVIDINLMLGVIAEGIKDLSQWDVWQME